MVPSLQPHPSHLPNTFLPSIPTPRATWRRTVGECACKLPKVEESLLKYQEPTNVDKILKLDKQLNETKEVLYQTIDKVLARGEKLDELVAKSDGLSAQSKLFYKQAKKTNSCCIVM